MSYTAGAKAPLSNSPTYAAAVRARIQCGLLVKALQNHALGKSDMTPSQVQAANILLRKVVPDKAEVEATVRRVESLTEEQSRVAAEEMIESARHRDKLRQAQSDLIHDAVSPGLPGSGSAPQDSGGA